MFKKSELLVCDLQMTITNIYCTLFLMSFSIMISRVKVLGHMCYKHSYMPYHFSPYFIHRILKEFFMTYQYYNFSSCSQLGLGSFTQSFSSYFPHRVITRQ